MRIRLGALLCAVVCGLSVTGCSPLLALSVDGLDPSQPSEPADASSALQRLDFPFASGFATRELLDKLLVSESLLFNHPPGLAVPASFLFDANGDLAAVYQGSIELPRLMSDLQQLELPLRERRDAAVPLAGRWLSPPRQLLMRAVGRVFQENGYDEDYARYLQLDTELLARQRAQAQSDDERQQLDTQFAAANYNLALALLSAGNLGEAAAHFRRAIEVRPDHVEALVNLGSLLPPLFKHF